MIILAFILSLAVAAQAVESTPRWDCEEPVWVKEPVLEDDILVGRIASNCTVREMDASKVPKVLERMKSGLTSGKFVLHRPPTPFTQEAIDGLQFDVTDNTVDDGDKLSVRQTVFLGMQGQNRILCESASTKIEGQGRAEYLRYVLFRTEVTPAGWRFENELRIERPWYAIPPAIFRAVAKRMSRDKFLKARDAVLGRWTSHI